MQLPLLAAVQGPRFHHQWKPDHVTIEAAFDKTLRTGLEPRGHQFEQRSTFGTTQAISLHAGLFTAVSDPRGLGAAGVLQPNEGK